MHAASSGTVPAQPDFVDELPDKPSEAVAEGEIRPA